MVTTGFCNTCQRTVYLGAGDADVCPVCSSPLMTVAGTQDAVDDPAAARIAENEALFREINERIKHAAEGYGIEDVNEFLCECGDPSCTERLDISMSDYEAVRGNPLHFIVIPGHEIPEVEVVVAAHGGFSTVEKTGPPREIARARDPRAGSSSNGFPGERRVT